MESEAKRVSLMLLNLKIGYGEISVITDSDRKALVVIQLKVLRSEVIIIKKCKYYYYRKDTNHRYRYIAL